MPRLNWACGPHPAVGWTNSDRIPGSGVDLPCDLLQGLPVPEGTFEYAVGIHGLQDIPYLDLVPALRELRRVLVPGGVLRLGLPDLDRAIAAYLRGDARYFYVPDRDARSLGAKLVTQIVWYGSTPHAVHLCLHRRTGVRGRRRRDRALRVPVDAQPASGDRRAGQPRTRDPLRWKPRNSGPRRRRNGDQRGHRRRADA